MLIDDRVKWPSERSEWLLDAAAAPTPLKPTATLRGGSKDRLLSSSFLLQAIQPQVGKGERRGGMFPFGPPSGG